MTETQTKPSKRIEIAYMAFGRDDRLTPKRKRVSASALEKTLAKLREEGAMNIATRDAEG